MQQNETITQISKKKAIILFYDNKGEINSINYCGVVVSKDDNQEKYKNIFETANKIDKSVLKYIQDNSPVNLKALKKEATQNPNDVPKDLSEKIGKIDAFVSKITEALGTIVTQNIEKLNDLNLVPDTKEQMDMLNKEIAESEALNEEVMRIIPDLKIKSQVETIEAQKAAKTKI